MFCCFFHGQFSCRICEKGFLIRSALLYVLSVSYVLIRFSWFTADKKVSPKAANDVKLIYAGKILENSRTVGQCKTPFGELPNGVITLHAVVQPSLAKAKSEKKIDKAPNQSICSCSIL
ncbi:Membrane-anchored ubiquitin-fold protein 4 [Capsicum annuum]|uniref:Membrane-anchored ubiquitin-fold protein 4 n=1 Tax=Capsicum annuum TaxID=4072 RepID=A0A2G3ACW6_CAPAN|nr:Membrane-anchored ubiquitin-fold protein 4 [Capsicum annuum]